MAIFNSHVKLPEGKSHRNRISFRALGGGHARVAGLRAKRFSDVAALHEEPDADAAHGDHGDHVLGARGAKPGRCGMGWIYTNNSG